MNAAYHPESCLLSSGVRLSTTEALCTESLCLVPFQGLQHMKAEAKASASPHPGRAEEGIRRRSFGTSEYRYRKKRWLPGLSLEPVAGKAIAVAVLL